VGAGGLQVRSPEAAAADLGHWGSFGGPIDLAGDQRPNDGQALCFDLPVATEAVELLGFPHARLRVAADRRAAIVAARLCDVAPDGTSRLVTLGFLDLTHRHGHDRVEALHPGEPCSVDVALNAVAYRLPAGHRWRLAVSSTYWPWIWPVPEPATLTLHPGSSLELPVLDPGTPTHAPPPHFAEPEHAAAP
ncbi:peptidase S15, partial [Acidimicrobiaceae bacterium USS-CC1]|nr:peptidase S15 [Acidiferrimicrobium australe]